MDANQEYIWIFMGEGAKLPSGIFSTYEKAIEWIEKYKLLGYLSKFPLDTGVYDWAMKQDYYRRRPHLKFDRQVFATGLLYHEHITEKDYEVLDENGNGEENSQ